MVRSKRKVLVRCFLFLVTLVSITGFLYFAASNNNNRDALSWPNSSNVYRPTRHRGVSTVFNSRLNWSRKSDASVSVWEEVVKRAQKVRVKEWNKVDFLGEITDNSDVISKASALGNQIGFRSTVGNVSSSGNHETSMVSQLPANKLAPDDIPNVAVKAVSCAKLIEGDSDERRKAEIFQKLHRKIIIPDEEIYKQASNCSAFLSDRKYIVKPASEEEANFRLAFSIVTFKEVEQFERLLRAIYRPQNFYCVHVDKKSTIAVQDAVRAIVNCFGNVFLAPEQFDVQWGKFSVLEPELSCMKELLNYKKWRYFINLTGQEFPLKTNWEIVQILKIFNGANNLEGTIKRRNTDRTANKPPPPANITVTKGSVHIVATRGYIDFVVHNETSLKFREWARDTYVPDETYFSSLNFNPHLKVPGSYLGEPETDTKKNLFITRFKNWGDGPFNWPCAGQRVRMVCIFAVGDLPMLATRVELFANKFYLDYEPLALDCLEELHYNRTRLEARSVPDIDRRFYESLDFVRNHL